MGPKSLIAYCGFLLTLSGFSVDIMLPVFYPMSQELQAPLSQIQMTIPVFLGTFAVGQVICGPLSDRFGRRPIIALGLGIFLLGAIIAAVGGTITEVLIGRAVQGLGAAAGPVLGRAIIRDSYTGTGLARAMAAAMAIFSIGPILAPLFGHFIDAVLGWRFIFTAMGGLALALIIVDLFLYRETNLDKDPKALKAGALWSAFVRLVSHRQSLRFLILATTAHCALMNYVANGSRVYQTSFNVGGLEFAVLFSLTGIGIIIGQIVNRRVLPRLGILKTLRIASLILFFASAMITALALAGALTAYLFTALMFAFNTSFLVVISNSLTLIIDPHPKIAGLVSAFFGFATTVGSSLFVVLTFDLFNGEAVLWGIGMTIMTAITLFGMLLTRQSDIDFNER